MDAVQRRRLAEERELRRKKRPDRGHIVKRATLTMGEVQRTGDVFPLVVYVKSGSRKMLYEFSRFCERNGVGVERDERGFPKPIYDSHDGRTDAYEVVGTLGALEELCEHESVTTWHYAHSSRGHRFPVGANRDRATGVVQAPSGTVPQDASASVRRELSRRRMGPEERRATEHREKFPAPPEKPAKRPWQFRVNYAALSDRVARYKLRNGIAADVPLSEATTLKLVEELLGEKLS